MAEKATYLLPVWVDLTFDKHKVIMETLNNELHEFFEEQCEQIAALGCAVDVQWSICKHVKLGEEGTQE